ncbi:MAG: hypothetical protein L0922_06330, partial [Candidatus Mariimomonas ferrooxydans]
MVRHPFMYRFRIFDLGRFNHDPVSAKPFAKLSYLSNLVLVMFENQELDDNIRFSVCLSCLRQQPDACNNLFVIPSHSTLPQPSLTARELHTT